MQIQVRYFAELRERAGCERQTLQLDTLTDAAGVYRRLQQQHGFRFPLEALRVARNGKMVSWDVVLAEGDEIDLLPPFSGG